MKILVDINHPAHVHYFKNFIWEMKKKGHDVLITASEKDVTCKLLNAYGFDYINMRNYGNSLLKKLINIPIMDLKMYIAVKNFKPDIFVGFGSIRAAHTSFLIRKKCINFEDTENSMEQIRLYLPFVDAVCTSTSFKRDLGRKQVRFNGYMELTYLHPNYFKPNPEVLDELNLSKDDKFVILRFVSWSATHDIGHKGLNLESKIKVVKELEKYAKVFITSESKLNKELEKYRITISPEKMHDVLYYATLLYGESATMASECAVLGTHAIFHDFAGRGYTDEEEKIYNLVFNFKLDKEGQRKALEKAVELLQNNDLKKEGKRKREQLLNDKIDVTKFMVDFIENFSKSFEETNDILLGNLIKKVKYFFILNRKKLSRYRIYQFFFSIYDIYYRFLTFYYGFGSKNVVCPVCGFTWKKIVNGNVCPKCWGGPRHRLLALYLKNVLKPSVSTQILDIAPNKATMYIFNKNSYKNYISIDLDSPVAMFNMDLTDLKFEDNKFDLIICYHVLEHIKNDTKAMEEIYRVLKPNGVAILQVPFSGKNGHTFELDGYDWHNKEMNIKLYGHPTHVRRYGEKDYVNKLKSIGFNVELNDYVKSFSDADIAKYGLDKNETLYICHKN